MIKHLLRHTFCATGAHRLMQVEPADRQIDVTMSVSDRIYLKSIPTRGQVDVIGKKSIYLTHYIVLQYRFIEIYYRML